MNAEEQDECVKRRGMGTSPRLTEHSEKEENEMNSTSYVDHDEKEEEEEEKGDEISIEKFALEQSDGFWDLAMYLLSYVYLIIHPSIHPFIIYHFQ